MTGVSIGGLAWDIRRPGAAVEEGVILVKLLSLTVPFAMTFLFFGASTTPAYAYLDPGTGSMILQVLLGGAAGVALAGKLYWHRFLTMIGKGPAVAHDEQPEGGAVVRPSKRPDN